ncbi:metal ABC transporter permease [Paenibacillus thermoaerophilus]|uniref:Metal ABC transporter permease n=1 Tax=Paenibacillus thermoaerophilus TaxID=1215385 RepID=A0ABW2V5L0_9BACL|nr:metal ABC transporter permease [Paenibacillus thermoaerophilus]TMV18558.1 metal ABC transporter permease [Paenibacillus thermoaerophilus]
MMDILRDPNALWILLGCMLLGLSSGVVGSFAYLRKESLMGDALAHAALPGVCLAYLISGTKSMGLFVIGAAAAGLAATWMIGAVTRHTRLKSDTALALVLSLFFGAGIVLLTEIQHSASGNQSGLDKFLFGQAASMVQSDVWSMAIVSVLVLGVCALLFKEFKLTSFDPGFARGVGFPVRLIESLLMLLIVVTVVAGIQAVGVVLMSALLISPAVSARYWTDRLGMMVGLSGLFGAISGLSGTYISTLDNNLPTGALSVLAATLLFGVSVLFAPRRGLVAKGLRRLLLKREVRSQVRMASHGSAAKEGQGA